MHSSPGSAASRRAASGADSTGLPAMVMSALIWPSPGVAISSARQESGNCPSTSGAPRTRLSQRPNSKPSANSGGRIEVSDQRDGVGEHRAALAVEVAGEHVQHLHQPGGQGAELLGAGADAPVDGAARASDSSRARRRIVSAGTRQQSATASGAKSRARRSHLAEPRSPDPRGGRDARGPRRRARAPWRAAARRRCPVGWRSTRRRARRSRCAADRRPPPGRRAPRMASSRPEHVRRGQQASLRGVRVGAEHQQEVGAVEVGQRECSTCRRTAARTTTFFGHWSTVPAE